MAAAEGVAAARVAAAGAQVGLRDGGVRIRRILDRLRRGSRERAGGGSPGDRAELDQGLSLLPADPQLDRGGRLDARGRRRRRRGDRGLRPPALPAGGADRDAGRRTGGEVLDPVSDRLHPAAGRAGPEELLRARRRRRPVSRRAIEVRADPALGASEAVLALDGEEAARVPAALGSPAAPPRSGTDSRRSDAPWRRGGSRAPSTNPTARSPSWLDADRAAMSEAPPPAEIVPEPAVGRVFEKPMRPGIADVAPSGRARLDAIARWLQDIAYLDVVDAGFEHRCAWIVRRTRIRAEALPQFGEDLVLRTFCSGIGRFCAERRTVIAGPGASVQAVATWVALDPERLVPTPLRRGVRSALRRERRGARRQRAAASPRAAAGRGVRPLGLPLDRPRSSPVTSTTPTTGRLSRPSSSEGRPVRTIDAEIEHLAPGLPGEVTILRNRGLGLDRRSRRLGAGLDPAAGPQGAERGRRLRAEGGNRRGGPARPAGRRVLARAPVASGGAPRRRVAPRRRRSGRHPALLRRRRGRDARVPRSRAPGAAGSARPATAFPWPAGRGAARRSEHLRGPPPAASVATGRGGAGRKR